MLAEFPVLRLGLAGFSVQYKQAIEAALQAAVPGGVAWRLDRLADADAWWVNGSKLLLRGDGTLRVGSGCPSEPAFYLNLREVDRPIAFSQPVAVQDIQPALTFAADSAAGMRAILEQFTESLMHVASQFCLAGRILQNEATLGAGIYHVSHEGVLLAVVNLQGEIGVSPKARPDDFDDATWSKRPAAAAGIPESFVRTSLSQLMWQYAVRTRQDVLPKRYRSGLLYFRRPPRLPHSMLRDSHLLLIRELAQAPASFESLQQRTGLAPARLARDLAALYLVGSVTSNPKRAAPVSATGDAIESRPGLPYSHPPQDGDHGVPPDRKLPVFTDRTAPAPMSSR